MKGSPAPASGPGTPPILLWPGALLQFPSPSLHALAGIAKVTTAVSSAAENAIYMEFCILSLPQSLPTLNDALDECEPPVEQP